MGGVEDDEPPSKRVKVSSEELTDLSSSRSLKESANCSLSDSMARPLASQGDEEMVGSKGVIKRVEFVRIITEALYSLGYKKTGAQLEEESGIPMHSSVVNTFMQQILDGKWDESVSALHEIGPVDVTIIKLASFVILEQKFFELLDGGKVMDALNTLRTEISPLCINTDRVRELSSCIISPSGRVLVGFPGQDIVRTKSRPKLLEELQKLLPPAVMIPERRLEHLVQQALNLQLDACMFHNSLSKEMSLYADHQCGRDQIPSQTLQILKGHDDEVWFLRFSHNGKYLASSSRDNSAIIWEISFARVLLSSLHPSSGSPLISSPDCHKFNRRDIANRYGINIANPSSGSPILPQVNSNGTVCLKHRLSGHQKPVTYVSWSLDDHQLLTCGVEEAVRRWDVSSGECLHVYEKGGLGLLSCAWSPNGKWIFSGVSDKSLCMWDLDGKELECLKGQRTVRISDLEVTSDGKWVITVCRDAAILLLDWEAKTEKLIEEDQLITSFTLSRDNKFLLVSLHNQEVHLWNIEGDVKLVAKYKGHRRSRFVIRSCFGGLEQAFISSGSEDSKIYIWQRSSGVLIEELVGHSGAVNCVSWNPVNPHMLASASDDRTIRIWGLNHLDMNHSNGVHHFNGNAKQEG